MHFKTLAVFCAACFLAAAQSPQRDTIAKPITEKEQKKREQGLRKELPSAYAIWEKTDVAYIITDEERQVDLPPVLRQMVKTHFSLNGELSHGTIS